MAVAVSVAVFALGSGLGLDLALTAPSGQDARAEAGHIVLAARAGNGAVSAADRAYLVSQVSAHRCHSAGSSGEGRRVRLRCERGG